MMIHAYAEEYVRGGHGNLGMIFDFAVYTLNYDIDAFFALFIATGLASSFGSGDFTLIAGKSGIELAVMVLEASAAPLKIPDIKFAS